MSKRTGHGSGSTTLLLAVLLVIDAVVVAAFTRAGARAAPDLSPTGGPSGAPTRAAPGPAERDAPRDDGWALCQTRLDDREVTPSAVAITYLDSGIDDGVTPEQVRAWLGALPASAVDVYALAHKDGSRRVALELARGKWPPWEDAARGQAGEAVCGRVRAALLAAGIGRPATDGASVDPARRASRHDFEFIYARRAKLYHHIQWLGTLEDALDPTRFAQVLRWLAPEPAGGEAP